MKTNRRAMTALALLSLPGHLGCQTGAEQSAALERLSSPEASDRRAAADRLGEMRSVEAIPKLIHALDDVDEAVRAAARQALIRTGEAAIPCLEVSMRHAGDRVGVDASAALIRIGPAAVPAFVDALSDRDAKIRLRAIGAFYLMEAGPATRQAIPGLALVASNAAEPVGMRVLAVRTLGQLGVGVEAAVPPLVEALQENELRHAAAGALERLGPSARTAAPALAEALESEDIDFRIGAAFALARVAPGARAPMPVLVEALASDEESVRVLAATYLGGVGTSEDTLVVDALETAGGDPSEDVRKAASDALAQIRATEGVSSPADREAP